MNRTAARRLAAGLALGLEAELGFGAAQALLQRGGGRYGLLHLLLGGLLLHILAQAGVFGLQLQQLAVQSLNGNQVHPVEVGLVDGRGLAKVQAAYGCPYSRSRTWVRIRSISVRTGASLPGRLLLKKLNATSRPDLVRR